MPTTPQSERCHVAFFGRCNSGKSSLINALTGQSVSIVSPQRGTTTDAVNKPMELPGVGAAVLIDTPGYDDDTLLGKQRMEQTLRVIERADVAVLLVDCVDCSLEKKWLEEFAIRDIPAVVVLSQCDKYASIEAAKGWVKEKIGVTPIAVSAITGMGIDELHRAIATTKPVEDKLITENLINNGDTVVLVMPQDAQAPRGRLIQPQVQTIRELLDRKCTVVSCTAEGLSDALAALSRPPHMIITDSQVFDAVYALKPAASGLTSFSVLFARYKGDIDSFVEGASSIMSLPPQGHILIAEACTHAPKHEDIGRVKLPALLRRKVSPDLIIDVVGGADFPEDLTPYDLIIHCGACMFNRRHVLNRIARAKAQRVPITNYGIAIAALTGILDKIDY